MVIPEEAGTGHAPQSLAKAASERIRSGLSPKIITIAAAVLAPTAKPSRRVGDVSAVSRARCRSCVVISLLVHQLYGVFPELVGEWKTVTAPGWRMTQA